VVTVTTVELKMPTPKQKPVPVVLAPDSDETRAAADVVDDPDKPKMDDEASAANMKLSRAERVIRARHLLKAGTKHLAQGETQQARETLSECIDLDPQAAECHKSLGMLYRRVRLSHKAREHFTRYLELAPDAADADKVRKMLQQ
jgi:regulator of sirC expression with transglutaminase-like and TPR domain